MANSRDEASRSQNQTVKMLKRSSVVVEGEGGQSSVREDGRGNKIFVF